MAGESLTTQPPTTGDYRSREKALLELIETALDQLAEQQSTWLTANCPQELLPRAERMLNAARLADDNESLPYYRTNAARAVTGSGKTRRLAN